MTKKDTELIAAAIAEVEKITEQVDLNGIGASTLRLAVSTIGAALKYDHPRFNVGAFEKAALPIQAERQKQAILRALGQS